MCLYGVAVDLQHADEDIDGLVLLLVEQVIQPLDVFGPENGVRAAAGFPPVAAGTPPSPWQQQRVATAKAGQASP